MPLHWSAHARAIAYRPAVALVPIRRGLLRVHALHERIVVLVHKRIVGSHRLHVIDMMPFICLRREQCGRHRKRISSVAVHGRGHVQSGVLCAVIEDVLVQNAPFLLLKVILSMRRIDRQRRRPIEVVHGKRSHYC